MCDPSELLAGCGIEDWQGSAIRRLLPGSVDEQLGIGIGHGSTFSCRRAMTASRGKNRVRPISEPGSGRATRYRMATVQTGKSKSAIK